MESKVWLLETNFGRFETTNLDQAFKVESLKLLQLFDEETIPQQRAWLVERL
jgi:hypothetical protein